MSDAGARSTAGAPAEFTMRPLRSIEEYRACVALQKATWGQDFSEVAPPSLLMAAREVGGVAAGAFTPAGELAGFVFGLTGVRDGRIVHWSDMLAVHPDYRDRGLGTRLKWYQRERLLTGGAETVFWTFDPLESRNAHVNLNRLGALAREYRRNVYGESDSVLHAGIGTDRLVAEWPIRSDRVASRAPGADGGGEPRTGEDRGAPDADAPVVNPVSGNGLAIACAPPRLELDAPTLLVAVPGDIQALKQADLDRARVWRERTRTAFEHYLDRGYRALALVRRGDWSAYRLEGPGG